MNPALPHHPRLGRWPVVLFLMLAGVAYAVEAPAPAAKAPAKAGGNQRTILIIAAVVVLCLACCCLSYSGYYIYSNHMFGL